MAVFDPLVFDSAAFDTAPGVNLHNITLAQLLPPNLLTDPFAAACAEAFDVEFHLLVEDTARILLFALIDEQPAEVLDHLAWQFSVDFYDQRFSLADKRELIKKALYWHGLKGTAAAVERVVESVFVVGVVEEWFDYSGAPYHFRVRTAGGVFPDDEKYDLILRMVRVVKRASAIFERLQVEQEANHPLFFAGAMQIGQHVTIGSA